MYNLFLHTVEVILSSRVFRLSKMRFTDTTGTTTDTAIHTTDDLTSKTTGTTDTTNTTHTITVTSNSAC